MYAEYDPIGLFERNKCFRVNIQTFQKIEVFYTPKMAQKSKFLGFFRNHARNVLYIEIHLPERNFGRKKLFWVF